MYKNALFVQKTQLTVQKTLALRDKFRFFTMRRSLVSCKTKGNEKTRSLFCYVENLMAKLGVPLSQQFVHRGDFCAVGIVQIF